MSKTQGQQTLSLQKAYRAAGHPERINHAQSALKHRKLGHDHIDGVIEALHAKIDAAPVKLWLDSQETGNNGENVKLNNRSSRISMAFMDAPDPAKPHLFVPTVSKFSVNPLHL
jgi:hypothetical protein